MDDARSEYYATQMKTLARIAAALERQNDLLESIYGGLQDVTAALQAGRDEDGALWVRMNG